MALLSTVARTAEQIMQEMEGILIPLLPEITNIEAEPYMRVVLAHAAIAENLHFYLDRMASETNVESAILYKSLVYLALSDDVRVRSRVPYKGIVRFTLSAPAPSPITIPKGTLLETGSGLAYTTTIEVTIATGETIVETSVYQQSEIPFTEIGVTNGTPNQIFTFSEKLVDGSVLLSIGGETYTPVETFYESYDKDTHFFQTVNFEGKNWVILGDGVNGKLPAPNQTVYASFALTEGAKGKALAGEIQTIVSNISLPATYTLSCNNPADTQGGKNKDTVDEIRRRVKSANHTTEIAVTRSSFGKLGELVAGVAKCDVFYKSGNRANIYIVPLEGGIASPVLINEVTTFYEERIPICMQVSVQSAGEVRLLLHIEVDLNPNAVKTQAGIDIKNALVALGSLENQTIRGRTTTGTISQTVCNAPSVRTCIIKEFSYIPYAKPLQANTDTLAWQTTILEGATSVEVWKIQFTSATQFQLYRNKNYLGVFDVAEEVTTSAIRFTILQTYSVSKAWEFTTYPYLGIRNGAYQLDEPSVLRILANDITLTLNGGI